MVDVRAIGAGIGAGIAGVAGGLMLPRVAGSTHAGLASGIGLVAGSAGVVGGLVSGGRLGGVLMALGAGLAIGSVTRMQLDDTPSTGASAIRDAGRGVDHAPEWARPVRDLAVAWWPEEMHVEREDGARRLRFQTIVANVGSEPIDMQGSSVEYDVFRRNADGSLGARVSGGAASLEEMEVVDYPPPFGVEVGHPSSSFGETLSHVGMLGPLKAGIIGVRHASQGIDIGAAGDGVYVLRETIRRGEAAGRDDVPADDVRDTDFLLKGDTVLQAASEYPNVR